MSLKTSSKTPNARKETEKSRLYSSRDMRVPLISKNQKPVSLVRRTEYEIDGETIIKSETMKVQATVWRDAQGRFISPKKVKMIERELSKLR